MDRREFTASLVAGGCAGMCVDLTLFPLDTIKTRLQSQRGFSKAGGFRGIYVGVPSAAVGSFPNGGLSDPRAHRGGKAACAGIALLQYPAGAAGNPAGRGPKGSVQGLPEHRAQGDSLLLGAVSFMGIFEEPLVTGTRSHPALLAGCCVWSVRRWGSCVCHHTSRCSENQNHVSEAFLLAPYPGSPSSASAASSSSAPTRRSAAFSYRGGSSLGSRCHYPGGRAPAQQHVPINGLNCSDLVTMFSDELSSQQKASTRHSNEPQLVSW
ncbi:mitochondrial S-adenosylmethionine carrier protein isoform X1 [Scleropages formosus]|uniref:mitochondrial S-adenosylmethionine carrier protein isoform X1 n=1 Tax=Scleropages formosus TaxID=113540 RepID=UPI0010FAC6B9|nr:S-adenosylmethionine mitochondrial carrier protein isoform X1 [Scleropages formosus]